jgi:hypothetical protein
MRQTGIAQNWFLTSSNQAKTPLNRTHDGRGGGTIPPSVTTRFTRAVSPLRQCSSDWHCQVSKRGFLPNGSDWRQGVWPQPRPSARLLQEPGMGRRSSLYPERHCPVNIGSTATLAARPHGWRSGAKKRDPAGLSQPAGHVEEAGSRGSLNQVD